MTRSGLTEARHGSAARGAQAPPSQPECEACAAVSAATGQHWQWSSERTRRYARAERGSLGTAG